MNKPSVWLKVKKIFIEVVFVIACCGAFYAIGMLVFQHIPTAIRGYREVAVETTEDDDWMGISHEKVTKTRKQKVTADEIADHIIADVVITLLSVGYLLVYPNYRTKKKEENEKENL